APYAVINETVSGIRRSTDKFLANMANAVLRQIAAQKDDLRQKIDTISPLPATFIDILDGYTPKEIAQIAQSVYQVPPLDITVKENPSVAAEKYGARILPNGTLRLPENTKVAALPDFEKSAWVQDVAAAFPVQFLGDVKNLSVVDLCAAPGGKTAQLAAAGAHVKAIDISATRLQTLQENMSRLNLKNVEILNADALQFLQTTDEQFDVILLDAPCSATGTFRRHPEVLHIKTADDVAAQVLLQRQLLDACSRVLRVGGILMYSVCSISKKEGEEQIASFLQNNKNFKIVPLAMSALETCGKWQQNMITPTGTLRSLPFYERQKGGMDSFFICKMQRII
ncbi:MAG: RsmB/NOP family class I SAM-dependent RNA methyltransferase, partial [Alphaproteobacteria bacterium]|nr:RsmB/NOP family class I SAM-dependent RNA methyltransferase [Alphaproteobacteria bacterium]